MERAMGSTGASRIGNMKGRGIIGTDKGAGAMMGMIARGGGIVIVVRRKGIFGKCLVRWILFRSIKIIEGDTK